MKNLNPRVLIVFILIVFIFFSFSTEAGTEHNVRGWLWSENIGWISMNNLTSGGIVNYGVNIASSTGEISGYAWAGGGEGLDPNNPNATITTATIGWIDFAPSGPYPSLPHHSAIVNTSTGEVTGWARACSVFQTGCEGALDSNRGGWNGWISLSTSTGLYGVFINTSTKEFEGWAYGGGDSTSTGVIGWISFNCRDGGENQNNICSQSNYKATTSFSFAPTVSNANSTLVSPCEISSLYPRLDWNVDQMQAIREYEIEITGPTNNYPSGTTTIISRVCSIACNSSHQLADSDFFPDSLRWGQNYTWRVRVRSETGAWSNWTSGSFTTLSHKYPEPYFSFSPQKPNVKETVNFKNESICYSSGDTVVATCTDLLWNFGINATPTIVSTLANPTTSFVNVTNSIISLTTTDPYNPSWKCSTSTFLKPGKPIPKWEEVNPSSWLKNFFASLLQAFENLKIRLLSIAY